MMAASSKRQAREPQPMGGLAGWQDDSVRACVRSRVQRLPQQVDAAMCGGGMYDRLLCMIG